MMVHFHCALDEKAAQKSMIRHVINAIYSRIVTTLQDLPLLTVVQLSSFVLGVALLLNLSDLISSISQVSRASLQCLVVGG